MAPKGWKDVLERLRDGWTLSQYYGYEAHPLVGFVVSKRHEPEDHVPTVMFNALWRRGYLREIETSGVFVLQPSAAEREVQG